MGIEVRAFGETDVVVAAGLTRSGEEGSAVFSADLACRYALTRKWADTTLHLCPVVIMLNPSTADADTDDATVRKVRSLLRRDGHGGMVVVNLFGYRTRSPAKLLRQPDAEGEANARVVRRVIGGVLPGVPVVAAWGAYGSVPRVGRLAGRLAGDLAGQPLWCWGTTRAGDPRHPLYLPGKTPLVRWREP